jgi:hypothetical protein
MIDKVISVVVVVVIVVVVFVVSTLQSPLQNALSCALSFWLEARYTKTCFRKPFVDTNVYVCMYVCGDCVIDDSIHEWCQHMIDGMPTCQHIISDQKYRIVKSIVLLVVLVDDPKNSVM